MAGRPRLPTALKKLKGTAQPCRINLLEPQPAEGRPLPPPGLSDAALGMYELLGNTLEGMRVLTVADGLMLAEAARTWEELAQAREALAGHGALEYPTVTVVGTMWRAYPAVGMVSDAHRRWVACLAKLGLTPSDRSRLKLAEQPQTLTPLAALLAGAPSQRGQVGHA